MKLAIIGAGQRGMIYAHYAYEKCNAEIVAVVDISEKKREAAAEKFNIPANMQFTNVEDFYKLGKVADAVILATMDRDHFKHVMPAIDLGYDILLEKPISPDIEECRKIQENAHKHGVKILCVTF
jgi:predicted dehydrogenase